MNLQSKKVKDSENLKYIKSLSNFWGAFHFAILLFYLKKHYKENTYPFPFCFYFKSTVNLLVKNFINLERSSLFPPTTLYALLSL